MRVFESVRIIQLSKFRSTAHNVRSKIEKSSRKGLADQIFLRKTQKKQEKVNSVLSLASE